MIAEVLDQCEIIPDDIIRVYFGPSRAAFSELTVGEVSLVFVKSHPLCACVKEAVAIRYCNRCLFELCFEQRELCLRIKIVSDK